MKLARRNITKKEDCVIYYGEGGSPYTPYTSSYAGGGAVMVNLGDILPSLPCSYYDFNSAWKAFKNEITIGFNSLGRNVKRAFSTAKKWFKSFF